MTHHRERIIESPAGRLLPQLRVSGGLALTAAFGLMITGVGLLFARQMDVHNCVHSDELIGGQRIQKVLCDFDGNLGFDRVVRTPPDGGRSGRESLYRIQFGSKLLRIRTWYPGGWAWPVVDPSIRRTPHWNEGN